MNIFTLILSAFGLGNATFDQAKIAYDRIVRFLLLAYLPLLVASYVFCNGSEYRWLTYVPYAIGLVLVTIFTLIVMSPEVLLGVGVASLLRSNPLWTSYRELVWLTIAWILIPFMFVGGVPGTANPGAVFAIVVTAIVISAIGRQTIWRGFIKWLAYGILTINLISLLGTSVGFIPLISGVHIMPSDTDQQILSTQADLAEAEKKEALAALRVAPILRTARERALVEKYKDASLLGKVKDLAGESPEISNVFVINKDTPIFGIVKGKLCPIGDFDYANGTQVISLAETIVGKDGLTYEKVRAPDDATGEIGKYELYIRSSDLIAGSPKAEPEKHQSEAPPAIIVPPPPQQFALPATTAPKTGRWNMQFTRDGQLLGVDVDITRDATDITISVADGTVYKGSSVGNNTYSGTILLNGKVNGTFFITFSGGIATGEWEDNRKIKFKMSKIS